MKNSAKMYYISSYSMSVKAYSKAQVFEYFSESRNIRMKDIVLIDDTGRNEFDLTDEADSTYRNGRYVGDTHAQSCEEMASEGNIDWMYGHA